MKYVYTEDNNDWLKTASCIVFIVEKEGGEISCH